MRARALDLWQRPPIAGLCFALVWLVMTTSGLVIWQPAPFDLAMVAVLVLAYVLGLRLPAATTPMTVSLIVLIVLGMIGAMQTQFIVRDTLYMVKTAYVSVIAIFFASLVAAEPARALRTIMSGYMVAAFVAAAAGFAGIFKLAPFAVELFTEGGRARGPFQDPNVFGPFLIPPLLYLIVQALRAPTLRLIWLGGLASVLAAAVLLSFSRGAWGVLVMSLGVTIFLVLATSPGHRVRTRVFVSGILVIAFGALAVSAVLADPDLTSLFGERFSLVQRYDVSGQGRFAGQAAALEMMVTRPFGVGATAFAEWWGQNPHNVYVKSLLIGGWAGGVIYLFLVIATLAVGFDAALRPSPYRDLAIILFASFFAIAAEGMIIDTDHWRQFYLLVGLIWGIHAALARERSGVSARGGSRPALQST